MTKSPHVEIERKFLVTDPSWRGQAPGIRYRQGYLAASPGITVRVRVGGGRGVLTIKGASSPSGISRAEYEFPVPEDQANEILDGLCEGRVVEKTRHRIDHGGFVWEVDDFHGAHEGLVLAEIELQDEDQEFEKPSWAGEEVTGDYRYTNAWLAANQRSGQ
jgi:CYTH domain-containing protein